MHPQNIERTVYFNQKEVHTYKSPYIILKLWELRDKEKILKINQRKDKLPTKTNNKQKPIIGLTAYFWKHQCPIEYNIQRTEALKTP